MNISKIILENSKNLNDLQNKINSINVFSEDIGEIYKIKDIWRDISKKIFISSTIRLFLNNLFGKININFNKTYGMFLYKIILEKLSEFDKNEFNKIYLYIIIGSLINYINEKNPLISFNIIFNAINFYIPTIIKNNLNYEEVVSLLISLFTMIQIVYKEEKNKLNRLIRKIIRKKIPEDDISENMISKIIKIKDKLSKSDTYNIENGLHNEETKKLLKKLDSNIYNVINKMNNIIKDKKEEQIEEYYIFSFDNLLNEESLGIAKRAKDTVYRAIKSGKLKKPKRCSKCGKITSNLEAAHSNYNKPLKIRWLCKSCHGKDNKKQVKKRGYANGKYNPTGKWPKKYRPKK